jgi:hypothetical protein
MPNGLSSFQATKGRPKQPYAIAMPLEEAVDRQDAAAPMVGVVEGRQLVYGLAFGVDRLSSAFWVFAPVRDQPPAQRIERRLAGLVIAPVWD